MQPTVPNAAERRAGATVLRPSCRRAFHGAARAWALDAIANCVMTVADLKIGLAATRALVPAAFSGSPLPEHPLSAVPQPPTDEAAQQEASRAIPDKNLRMPNISEKQASTR